MVPFPESVEHGISQKPIITIPISLYRCGDGDDAEEGSAESDRDDLFGQHYPHRHFVGVACS